MKAKTYKTDKVTREVYVQYCVYDNISNSDLCYTKSKSAAEHICKLLNKLYNIEGAYTYKNKKR